MSGNLVGELILWLIIAIVAIVIGVYIVNWLYHRSSKEVSFVRTGFLGERVVINGGAFVLPFIHDYTPVNMNVLPMGIVRSRQDAVITRDRMSACFPSPMATAPSGTGNPASPPGRKTAKISPRWWPSRSTRPASKLSAAI